MTVAFAQTAVPADPAAVDRLAAQAPQTVDQAVRIDPGFVLAKVQTWVVGFQNLLPNIVVALIVFALVAALAWGVQRSLGTWAAKHGRANLGDVLGSFLKWVILFVGLLLSLTIVIPSLHPGDLIAGLGIGSVAIGFAFKDILQNWLAGLLILIQRPFDVGDQILVKDYEGTVERIETRATLITTFDGRRVIVPNADVYSSAVMVNTAYRVRRSQYEVGIGYGDDLDEACRVILDAVRSVEGVDEEKAPDTIVWNLGASSVDIRVRWWTDTKRTNILLVKGRVMRAVKRALDAAGIDMPFPTQVTLFHDQTEAADTRRGEQREGWPARRAGAAAGSGGG